MQFIKKTSSRTIFFRLIIKFALVLLLTLGTIFLLNKIDFPSPVKKIDKIIPNENFKIIK